MKQITVKQAWHIFTIIHPHSCGCPSVRNKNKKRGMNLIREFYLPDSWWVNQKSYHGHEIYHCRHRGCNARMMIDT